MFHSDQCLDNPLRYIINVYIKRSFNLATKKMCGGIYMMSLFMIAAGLAATYTITTFGPKLSLQNKTRSMKARMKELMLAHNNRVIP
jgi:hypothetical protein